MKDNDDILNTLSEAELECYAECIFDAYDSEAYKEKKEEEEVMLEYGC